jgi:hypothetical protein
MIRLDITERWLALSSNALELQRFILDCYGAARIEKAPFPHSALYDAQNQLLGYIKTYGYPRITSENDRMYLDLSDLTLTLGPERADIREQLAEYAHAAWSGWMQYMFSKGVYNLDNQTWIMPGWAVARWQRQLRTGYSDLPEEEKASDRAEADKILALFEVKE